MSNFHHGYESLGLPFHVSPSSERTKIPRQYPVPAKSTTKANVFLILSINDPIRRYDPAIPINIKFPRMLNNISFSTDLSESPAACTIIPFSTPIVACMAAHLLDMMMAICYGYGFGVCMWLNGRVFFEGRTECNGEEWKDNDAQM